MINTLSSEKTMAANYMHFLSTKHGNLIIEMTKICIFVSFVSLVASSEEH